MEGNDNNGQHFKNSESFWLKKNKTWTKPSPYKEFRDYLDQLLLYIFLEIKRQLKLWSTTT